MRIVRFGTIGGAATALNFAAFSGGVRVGLHYLVASTLAWTLSAAFGFVAHRRVTFGVGGPVAAREVGSFLASALAQLALGSALYVACIDGLHLSATAAFGVNLAVVPVFSFLVMRAVVFRPAVAA